ncbi:MAG: NupC/NupG family nucleoside CNT transporter [Planctomycetes bacterium]|nr:NupC/NupG family nucleoside CNT transporter [Planctomycetota bacterium]
MHYISLLGLAVMIGLAWLMSSHKNRFPWRVVLGGLVLQFVFAWVILRTTPGEWIFGWVNTIFVSLLSGVEVGSRFVFGEAYAEHFFAFKVLPTIIFFSALMSVFYYYGVIQKIVGLFALVMQKTLGTSGAETLSSAANVFVGQTEAPLVIRPYISSMTTSELNAVMVGGFATMAGGVLGALSEMGIDAGHLLSASVISAPGALLLSKVMQPEVDEPKTLGNVQIDIEEKSTNVLEAVAVGTTSGMKLALNVGAMLIVFLAMIAMINMLVGWVGVQFGFVGADGNPLWSLEAALSYLFYPLAWLIGIERADCMSAGELMGLKMATNEFVAYGRLSEWANPESVVQISERSRDILTYALCGFANFSSIGIQLGGIGGIAPNRRGVLARLGLRAMLGGTLATFMTGCIAALLL